MPENAICLQLYNNRESARWDGPMKKFYLLAVMGLFAVVAIAQQPALGDVARANKSKKHGSATTKLDDDNFSRSSTPDMAPAPKTDADDKQTADKPADAKDAKKDPAAAQKANDELTKKIQDEKKEISTLNR